MFVAGLFAPYLSVASLAMIDGRPLTADIDASLVQEIQTQEVKVEEQQELSADPVILVPAETETTEAAGLDEMPAALELEEVGLPIVYENKTDEEIFDLVVEHLKSLKTMKANFIQTAPSGNITTGELLLSRPGRLRFDYDEPAATLIVATQGLVYVHDKDLETTDSYPVNKTPLKFLLNRRVKTEDAVLTDVLRGQEEVTLFLESKDEETVGQIALVFSAPEIELRRWAVIDQSGGMTVVDLDNIKFGEKIANREFRIPNSGSSFTRDR